MLLQPVRHAWKVNECITAVNFYTASIQENNQYRLPFDGRLRSADLRSATSAKESCTVGTPGNFRYHAVPVTSSLKILGRETANSTQFTIVE